ncbi:hypothetical protein GCM10011490_16040 [Pseudoclavibacter endophyticus]|nr:DUF1990 family protein [Pseudoclavibacter endophyticus]GGA66169.1 hypothetical protein GCM10011490_16040 [Pseudoclavibacter endophyticus]
MHARSTTSRAVELAYGADIGFARDLPAARAALLDWRAHRGAGLRVRTSGPAAVGRRVELSLGPARLGLGGVDVVTNLTDEPGRTSMTYETLPGHAERGTQTFTLSVRGDRLFLLVTSRSVTESRLLRAAGGLSRLAQQCMAMRYVAALRRALEQRDHARRR